MDNENSTQTAVPSRKVIGLNKPRVLSATSIMSDRVLNYEDEDCGKINELMIDLESGRIAYAVLSFGGLFGMGNKLFAVPWEALRVDSNRQVLILNVNKERLKNAPGFDKDNWPDFADRSWGTEIHQYYGFRPYW